MNDQPQDHMEMSTKGTRDKGGFFKNLATNIKGPAVSVVLIAWIVALAAVALWGGENAKTTIGIFAVFIGLYIGGLGRSN
jgi:hypothetical protein